MANYAKVVNVPKPARGSYKPQRSAGLLLRSQVLHMREALLKHMEEVAALAAIDPKLLGTESDVSAYIHRATAILHRHSNGPTRK